MKRLLVLLSALATGCGSTNSVSGGTGSPINAPPSSVAPLSQILRGREIVTTAGCGDCHNRGTTDPNDPKWLAGFAGGTSGKFSIAGNNIFARNLTPDPTTGLGSWTDQQIFDALRLGKNKEGKYLAPPMPWPEYQNMTDEDIRAVVAYLRSIKAVSNAVPKNDNGSGGTVDTSIFYPVPPPTVPAYPGANEIEVTNKNGDGLPTDAATREQVLRGRYLVTAASDCNACHSIAGNNPNDGLYMAGFAANPANTGRFQIGPVTVFARNLTPDTATGLGQFSNNQVFQALRNGIDPRDGSTLKPPMPWTATHNYTDSDTWAIIAYLRSLRPVNNAVPTDIVPPGFPGFSTQAIPLPPYPGTNETP